VSPAAGRLGVAKSIVSRRLARLEAELGVQLLTRSTRGAAVTEAGAMFRDYAARVCAEVDAAREATGRRNGQGLTLGWHPSSRWSAAVGGLRNAIRFDEGRFTVRMATLRIDHTPSTQLAGSLLLQWDNVSHELGASGRVRWQWQPGRELIFSVDRLGYTGEQRDTLPGQTRALLKLVWTLER